MKMKPTLLLAVLLTAGLGISTTAAAQTPTDAAAAKPAATKPAADKPMADQAAPAADKPAADKPMADQAAPAADTTASQDMEVGSQHPAATHSITLAPHIGVIFPQVASDLGTWPTFGLSAGYILPFNAGSFVRPLELGVDVRYTQPGASGTGTDPNLGTPGSDPGTYNWDLTQQMLTVGLYGLWRFMPPGKFISAYALAGPRAYFMKAKMSASGNGGQDFGTNTQTHDEYGLVVGGGADFAVGPGTIFATLEFTWSDLNQRITGDSNTGALGLDAGYKFYF